MFSDAYPRNEIVLRRLNRVPPWIDKTWNGRQKAYEMAIERNSRPLDIGGKDRHRFFRRPIVPYLQPAVISMQFSGTGMEDIQEQQKEFPYGTQNHGTQTDYRDSETQTLPWAPPVLSHNASPPEILTLASLSWDHGLPAGMHEVEIIERARKKRAWEKLMPTTGDPKSIELMRHMIDTMERDEWLFREAEIETINKMRLELAQKLLKQIQQEEAEKLNDRVQRYWLSKQQEKNKKIQKIRNNCNRELRKLALRHKNIRMKYREVDIVEEYTDHKSELYGPQMRYGEHPKRSHEVINVRSRFLTHVKGLEILETMPKLVQFSDHLTSVPSRKIYELCIRETRWTEAVLTQLHQDLKDIRIRKFEETGPLRLIQRLPKPSMAQETPGTEGVSEYEEREYQSAVFLQKIIKGRAIQTLMCKGRHKYQELIEEMKSTTALQHADMLRIAQQREQAESLQRDQMIQQRQETRIKEIMSFLEGQTISSMLDFLSKELWRLQDERRIHAFAMLAERQRYKREAAEAGRRQTEERRRREHDEIFKQLIKVHQDTVDMYLEDLVMESMDWVAEGEARQHVRDLAQKIDKAAEEAELRQNYLEQEELVADLIHNFVVPEVQKQLIRKQIKQRQTKYLHEAHACIYNEVENLPPVEHHEKVFIEGDHESSESDKHNLILEESSKKDVTEKPETTDIIKEDGFAVLTSYAKELSTSQEEKSGSKLEIGTESQESIISEISAHLSESSEPKSEDEASEDKEDISIHKESREYLEEVQDQETVFREDIIDETSDKDVIDKEEEEELEKPQVVPRARITSTEEEEIAKLEVVTKPRTTSIDKEYKKDLEAKHDLDEEEKEELAKSEVVTKHKIILTDKEFKKDLKIKHELGFAATAEGSDSKPKQRSKLKIGFKESDEEINEETTKYQKTKHKIGFKIDDE